MLFDSSRKRGRAFVVESGAIDQRLIFGQAKQSRSWIAGLRMKRNRAGFDKAKTERREWL